jgi:hypothetical protein
MKKGQYDFKSTQKPVSKKDWSKSDTTSISFLVELNNVRINRVQCHLTGSQQYKNHF